MSTFIDLLENWEYVSISQRQIDTNTREIFCLLKKDKCTPSIDIFVMKNRQFIGYVDAPLNRNWTIIYRYIDNNTKEYNLFDIIQGTLYTPKWLKGIYKLYSLEKIPLIIEEENKMYFFDYQNNKIIHDKYDKILECCGFVAFKDNIPCAFFNYSGTPHSKDTAYFICNDNIHSIIYNGICWQLQDIFKRIYGEKIY